MTSGSVRVTLEGSLGGVRRLGLHRESPTVARVKESRSRKPVTADHPVVAAAIRVLEDRGGGPLTSREIFELAVAEGLLDDGQYNTLRARLSQHCGIRGAEVVRARGSSKVRGSRRSAWVLSGVRRRVGPAVTRGFETSNERRLETLRSRR